MLRFPLRRLARTTTARFVRVFLTLAFLLGALTGAAAGTDVPKPSATSIGPGLPFAIADFDGDHLPDLVDVQSGQGDVSRTYYRIQFELSASGRQAISLVAPTGGLQIAARDVNGDQIPDLILTTTWLRQPVAIFINDGHGTFTRAETAAFPEAFHESQTQWNSYANRVADAFAFPPPSQDGACVAAGRAQHTDSRSSDISSGHPGFSSGSCLISQLGRAPPSAVPHL